MNRELLRPIAREDIEAYRRDGVVCIRGQFDTEWIEHMRGACERDMAEAKGRMREIREETGGRHYQKAFMWRDDPDFRDYALESPAAQIAAELAGLDEVRFVYDQLFIKDPGTVAPTQWHQDLPFWPFRGNDILSVWLALTPVTQESSGVVYVAGSHKWNKFYRAESPDNDPRFSDPTLEKAPEFHKEFDNPAYCFLSWDMEPGDALVHHPLTIHGAGGNKHQAQRRIGLSCRYMGGDAVWDPRDFVMKIDGTDGFRAGAFPVDDTVFPVAWRRPARAA